MCFFNISSISWRASVLRGLTSLFRASSSSIATQLSRAALDLGWILFENFMFDVGFIVVVLDHQSIDTRLPIKLLNSYWYIDNGFRGIQTTAAFHNCYRNCGFVFWRVDGLVRDRAGATGFGKAVKRRRRLFFGLVGNPRIRFAALGYGQLRPACKRENRVAKRLFINAAWGAGPKTPKPHHSSLILF